tara:strand:- start:4109 stop:4594 length:486 start_codon:yes stop_codon:yes gene_type:complete
VKMAISSAFTEAEASIERGDYTKCLTILKPLSEIHPLNSLEGDHIRMLMVTAFMGQGEEKKALNTCRLLAKSHNSELRQEAKQLLSILEAPSLERPANWSVHIPKINLASLDGEKIYQSKSNQILKESLKYPPTGPTKDLGFGFSAIAAILIIMLTIFLSQ